MSTGNNNYEPPARRKRPMISCTECHRRKEKCDRRQPCSRCIKRGRRNGCLYELDNNHAQPMLLPVESSNDFTPPSLDTFSTASTLVEAEPRLMGYANTNKGTTGIIRSLGESVRSLHNLHSRNGPSPATRKYMSSIREIPPQGHVDILVQDFFKFVAWQYDIVDEAKFACQLAQWRCLSHKQLSQAPGSLPASLRSFPALLFQVLAQALLFQPTHYDERLNDLKYTLDMELSDRAAEYSEAGHQIASSFKKSELTLTTVQAELMRACFEKTSGAVVEAWHTLGTAIRDAQELGLHEMNPDPDCRNPNLDGEQGRKVWLMIHLWDAHMAIVLGRPMSTKVNPKDVPFPAFGSEAPTLHVPQPCDVILCGYHTAYKFLQDIVDLERAEDWRLTVENIHSALLANIVNLPTWAKPQRSRQGEPPWLSAALEEMFTNVQFVLFALHRPFVFVESSSRARAFHSSTQILESQARLFGQTEPSGWKAFSLVYATFDAMVLLMALHILFPEEFMDQLPATNANLEWALDRLNQMEGSNKLASSAFNVVQRLHRKMSAAATPANSLRAEVQYGAAELDRFLDLEAEILQDDWGDISQSSLGAVLHPLPFTELLCEGSFSNGLAWEAETFHDLHQSHRSFDENNHEISSA